MRVIDMMRTTYARRIQTETQRHTHTHTHMQTTCSSCGGGAGTMCASCSSGTSDTLFGVCSCTPVFFGGFGVRIAAASPCSLPALSGAFIGEDAAAPCAAAVDPAPANPYTRVTQCRRRGTYDARTFARHTRARAPATCARARAHAHAKILRVCRACTSRRLRYVGREGWVGRQRGRDAGAGVLAAAGTAVVEPSLPQLLKRPAEGCTCGWLRGQRVRMKAGQKEIENENE